MGHKYVKKLLSNSGLAHAITTTQVQTLGNFEVGTHVKKLHAYNILYNTLKWSLQECNVCYSLALITPIGHIAAKVMNYLTN